METTGFMAATTITRTPVSLDELDQLVWLRREALAIGMTDRAIARAVASGEWARVRHGAFTAGQIWAEAGPDERHLLRAAAVSRAARCSHALSHLTSVLMNSGAVWGVDLSEVHLSRFDAGAGRREAGVAQHRGRLEPGSIVTTGGLPHTSALRAAVESLSLSSVDAERGLVITNSLLHQKKFTLAEFHAALEAVHRWPHSLGSQCVAHLASPLVESVGESRMQYFLWAQGFTGVEPQVEIRDAAGRLLGRVDFLLRRHGVYIEFDGMIKYTRLLKPGENVSDVVVREKLREEAIGRASGLRCFRVIWPDLDRPRALSASLRKFCG